MQCCNNVLKRFNFHWHLYGNGDIAFNAMNNKINAMKKHPEQCIFSKDFSKGSVCFNVFEGGTHIYDLVQRYIYNALPSLGKVTAIQ